MKINILILIIAILGYVNTADQGDWVDTYDLPIGFITHPFYAGYLNITSS